MYASLLNEIANYPTNCSHLAASKKWVNFNIGAFIWTICISCLHMYRPCAAHSCHDCPLNNDKPLPHCPLQNARNPVIADFAEGNGANTPLWLKPTTDMWRTLCASQQNQTYLSHDPNWHGKMLCMPPRILNLGAKAEKHSFRATLEIQDIH